MWFLYGIGTTYALSVAFFYVFARYRFPIALVLMLLAAGGIIEVLDRVRLRRWRSLAVPAVDGLAMVASNLPIEDTRRFRATHYLSIAIELSKDPAQVEAATAFYQRALDAAPGLPSAQLGLGVLLAQSGQEEEAIAHYRKALAEWPDYAEARYALAEALAVAGQLPEAAQEFAVALRLSPGNADAHIEFGRTLNAMCRFDRALAQFRQGLAVKPRDTRGLVGLGVALSQLGRAEEAMRNFQFALEIDPEVAVAHNNLGWMLARQERIAEAIPHFERAWRSTLITRMPEGASMRRERSFLGRREGNAVIKQNGRCLPRQPIDEAVVRQTMQIMCSRGSASSSLIDVSHEACAVAEILRFEACFLAGSHLQALPAASTISLPEAWSTTSASRLSMSRRPRA